ncbi:hypothetical protein PSAC2689_70030 [Paraburkholderia sacchari]
MLRSWCRLLHLRVYANLRNSSTPRAMQKIGVNLQARDRRDAAVFGPHRGEGLSCAFEQ